MNELLNRLMTHELQRDQAEAALMVVIEWVEENYPVAGTLANAWMRNHSMEPGLVAETT